MSIIFKVQIFFEESHKKTRPESDQATKWLALKGFDARSSCFSDTFFVYYDDKNENKKNIFRENLDLHLLAMSERNCSDCALLITEEFQNYEEAKISTWFIIPPSDCGMWYFKNFVESNIDFYKKLKELRLFYSQIELRTKLIYGLSLLEEWFDTKPKHCLTDNELNNIIEAIEKLGLDGVKKAKVKNKIRDPDFLSEKTRNERIAEAVQKYSGLNLKETKNKIKGLYGARAKGAHSTTPHDLDENLNFLKSIFRAFLYVEYGFIKINLH